tara:strand:- start:699 stop:1763 length:1065 start_codon:yes stop_codon:yes gene_type:complete
MANLNFYRILAGLGSNWNPTTVPCNAGSISFSGGKGYYEAEAIVLGEGIGPVTCSFNAQTVPDRFRLVWSGSTVADSLIVGDGLKSVSGYNSYNSSLGGDNVLTRYQYNYTDNVWDTGSTTTVTYGSASFPPQSSDTGNFRRDNGDTVFGSGDEIKLVWQNPGWNAGGTSGKLESGNWGAQKGVVPNWPVGSGPNYSQSCVEGNVLLSFYKHTKYPTSFSIIIEGATNGTAWNLFSVSCPTGNSVNSSSISLNGQAVGTTIYHAAPTFDLRPGMKCYYDSAMTQPISSSQTNNDLYSGSFPTNPPSSGDLGDGTYAFGNKFVSGTTGFPNLVFYSGTDTHQKGMLLSMSIYANV